MNLLWTNSKSCAKMKKYRSLNSLSWIYYDIPVLLIEERRIPMGFWCSLPLQAEYPVINF
jgi:hypothetical protein